MFNDAFEKLDRLESEAVLEQINPAMTAQGFDASNHNVVVLSHNLDFYPGYQLLDIANYESTPPLRKFVIYKKNDVEIIDWTSQPFYALNKKAPLTISHKNVKNYVRVFLTYVRGAHGRFALAETIDDIKWREEPPPAARKALGKLIAPLDIIDETNGHYKLDANMMFKDTLYKATIHVDADGTVKVTDEELLVDDMPVLDDTFGQ